VVGLLVVAMTLQGCAAVGLMALGTVGGVAAGTGTNYTLDGIAYRTFAAPIADVERATQMTLKKMDMTLKSNEKTETGREMVADAGDRKIYIELERVTSRTTRMRITAKQGWFWRDRATAGEFIVQTEHALDELPVLTKTR
jgi:hypothetical protein